MGRDRREDEGQYYPGGKVIPTTPHQGGGSIVLDDTVTATSANGVKSSGIWTWVKSLLPTWLTPSREEPPTQASVAAKYTKPSDGIPLSDLKPTTFPPSAHDHTNDSWFTTAIEAVKTWASGAFAALSHSHAGDSWFTTAIDGKVDHLLEIESIRDSQGIVQPFIISGRPPSSEIKYGDLLAVLFKDPRFGKAVYGVQYVSTGEFEPFAFVYDILQLCQPFDAWKTGGYAVGEFCSYLDGGTLRLYQCTTAHTGEWIAAHFAARDVSALFTSANSALMGVVRYAFNSDGTIKDRAINAITYAGGALPNFPAQVTGYARDFLLNVTATATASDISLPESGATSVGDALAFEASHTYLVAVTEIAAKHYYIRIIDTTPANA